LGTAGRRGAGLTSSTRSWGGNTSTGLYSTRDVVLARDDAGILAQRNGTAAQTFRLYNTWGNNGVDFERTSLTRDSSGLVIDAQKGGTGADPTNLLDVKLDGVSKASVSSAGVVQGATLKVGADTGKGTITYATNSVSINPYGTINFQLSATGWLNPSWTNGASWILGSNTNESGNSNRAGSPMRLQPKGGSGDGSAAYLQLYTGLSTTSGTDGHTSELCVQTILPTTGMPGLAFGGVTSSFPALKRNAAVLETKLADDSAYAQHAASVFQAATAYTVGTLPGTPTVGMIARVTDGDSGLTFGNTVVNTGAGATPYLCWYNGTNWTVIGA